MGELEPGTMFLSFSKNGSRMPKGEAGAFVVATGVLVGPTGVLSLSKGLLFKEGLGTDVSIRGGVGDRTGILSGGY